MPLRERQMGRKAAKWSSSVPPNTKKLPFLRPPSYENCPFRDEVQSIERATWHSAAAGSRWEGVRPRDDRHC